jgi:HAD superfamily hydrolase (TIGR01662 family)
MRPRLQVVLFDLGNTLLYDDPAKWPEIYRLAEAALWDSLEQAGVRSTPGALYGPYETLLSYYYNLREPKLEEPGMARVLRGLLARHNILLPDLSLRTALDAMYSRTQANWYPEDDAIPTMEALRAKGLRLGLVSNGADDPNAHQLLEKAGLQGFFELVLSSASFGWRKPHPGIFRAALDHFGAPPEQVAMVGDSYEADILGAHAVGLNTIWLTRRAGNAPASIPIAPDLEVKALSEIPGAVASGGSWHSSAPLVKIGDCQ